MNLTENARAICPYYKITQGKEIQCEGCVKRARLVFVFRSQNEAIAHKRKFCDAMNWQRCPYAQMLNAQYNGWVHDFKRLE